VIVNPASGSAADADPLAALHPYFGDDPETFHLVRPEDSLPDLARRASEAGIETVVAVGGDGTVAAVAQGLVGTETPLGIVPQGTANVLSKELGIPTDLEAACRLIAGPHAVARIDAIEVAGRHVLTQVGVGLDALMIRDTDEGAKKRWGNVAYLATAATRLAGLAPRHFRLTIDGKTIRPRSSQIVLANAGTLGQPPFRWGPDIRPDDGRIDVCILRARSGWDHLRAAWYTLRHRHEESGAIQYVPALKEVEIAAERPLPVQGDGEIVGQTPLKARVVPGALRVIVPEASPG
jgi:YegS/Rv2252/BmrU family lipid kinase